MPFTAPDSDLLDTPKGGGFAAPGDEVVDLSRLKGAGFTSHVADLNRLSKPVGGGFQAPPLDLMPLPAPGAGVNKPSQFSSGYGPQVPISENPDWQFTKATRGSPVLTMGGDALNALNQKVIGPVAAAGLNAMSQLGENEAGIVPPKGTEDVQFEAGKPMLPEEAFPLAKEKGILPALTRTLLGFTTPESVATLPFAPASKAVQAAYLAETAAGVPDTLEKLASAQTPSETRDALTELGVQAAMGYMMGKGSMGKESFKAPPAELEPPSAAAPTPVTPPKPSEPAATFEQLQNLQQSMKTGQGEALMRPQTGSVLPPVDTSKVEVRTPDGQLDPVATAIARLKIEGQHGSEPPSEPAPLPNQTQASQPAAVPTVPAAPVASGIPLGKVSVDPRVQELMDTGLSKPDAIARAASESEVSGLRTQPENMPLGKKPNSTSQTDLDEQDALETVQEAVGLNKAQSARLAELQAKNKPLTEQPGSATRGVAAPGTDTVRTAAESSNASQRGQFPAGPETVAAPGVTAEGGSSPPLGAAALSKTSRADTARPFDLIDHIEGQVGTIDPALIKEANPDWKPVGAARKLFKPGGTPADSALNGLGTGHGVSPDMPLDQFGDAINAAAQARKGWRQQFYQQERQINEQARQTSTFQKDSGQATKTTQPLVPEDLNEGDQFMLKGAKFKVTRMDYDQDGRVTHLTLDDGKKYGTQEVDGQTALRMDNGTLVKGEAASNALKPSDIAEKLAAKLETLKSGLSGGGQLHAFGIAADLWDRAIEVAQKAIRAGGSVADAINAAIQHIKDNFKGAFQEPQARAALEKQLNQPAKPLDSLKGEMAQADADLRAKTNALANPEAGTQKARKQAAAVAAARHRTLRDELATHPDYVAEQILKQHQAITEANQILKPMGKTVTPEDFPNPSEVAAKLGPAAAKRVNELSDQIVAASSELARTNRLAPKMVDRITHEMMQDGRLPNLPEMTDLGAGRTLQKMTESLRNSEVDSPKASFAERLSAGKRIAALFTKGRDAVTGAWGNTVAAAKSLAETFKKAPEISDFKNVIKSWIGYDQRTSVENYQYLKELTSKVSNPVRRQAISVWLDAGGDAWRLKFERDSVPDEYRPVWDAALKLTADEKRIALVIKANFAAKLRDATDTGLLEKGREDYGVPQRWKTAPQTGRGAEVGEQRGQPGNPYAKLDPRDPFFSFARHTDNYFDGIMAKGVPENLDIGHLVSVYDEAFHKALSSRGAIKALTESTAKDGQPVTKLSGGARIKPGEEGATMVDSKSLPKDAVTADGRPYRSIDHWAMRGWKFAAKDTAGNPILLKGDMLVHPDHYDFLKNELNTPRWTVKAMPGEQRNIGERLGRGALAMSAYLKASKFIGPFHIVTEALHASFHGVVPSVHDFEINLEDPKQALLNRNMTLGFGHAREMFEDGLGSQKGIWSQIPGLGDAIVALNHFTFDQYIPKLKMKVGLAVLDRNMARYGKQLSPDQIAEITGRQMDAAFGGQNWRMMGTNKNMIAVARLAFVAPDFLLSRAKVIAQAFKPYNREQRIFLAAQALGVFTLCRVLNAIFSDDHDPHLELRNWDAVIIGKHAYHARFIVSDAANFARDMLGLGDVRQQGLPFISGRLGVIPKTGIEALTGKDLFTGQKAQGIWDANPGVSQMFSIAARDVAGWMTPMMVDGYIGGARKGQTGLGQVVAATVGVSSRKESPANDVWNLARQYNLSSKDPKTVNYQKQRDNDTGTPSQYSALNNLLDAGQLDKAKAEVQALQSQGKTISQILSHYQKFTYFTGSVAREQKFFASLTPAQQKTYQAAKAEQQARVAALNQALAK